MSLFGTFDAQEEARLVKILNDRNGDLKRCPECGSPAVFTLRPWCTGVGSFGAGIFGFHGKRVERCKWYDAQAETDLREQIERIKEEELSVDPEGGTQSTGHHHVHPPAQQQAGQLPPGVFKPSGPLVAKVTKKGWGRQIMSAPPTSGHPAVFVWGLDRATTQTSAEYEDKFRDLAMEALATLERRTGSPQALFRLEIGVGGDLPWRKGRPPQSATNPLLHQIMMRWSKWVSQPTGAANYISYLAGIVTDGNGIACDLDIFVDPGSPAEDLIFSVGTFKDRRPNRAIYGKLKERQ